MVIWLIICPVVLAAVAFAVPSNRWRPWLVPLGAIVHFVLMARMINEPDVSAMNGWLTLDPLSRVFVAFISVLFLICAFYAPAYLRLRQNRSNRVLCACLLLTLAMMTLVMTSHHLGLMWIAMEATTMATAPSLYFNHNPRSLEATWKYLLVCSVGIALALLGSFFLAYSLIQAGTEPTLLLDELVKLGPHLDVKWLHAAFVLLFVGYGTKMGLAPMHTWKPDAYGEAPGMIGALLAGGLTSCAFLAILRFYHISHIAHDEAYAQRIMVVVGLLSMAVAALFMVRQRDIKRLLAYSSVEHMGMLVFGIGIGGLATCGSLLHVIHNGLTKAGLFLAAANIHRAYGTKSTDDIRGIIWRLPLSGAMFLAGFFAITGSPPFGPFVSEYQIIRATFDSGNFLAGGLFILFLFVVFLGMGHTVVSCSLGRPSRDSTESGFHDSFATGMPIVVAMSLILLLGIYNPPQLTLMLDSAVAYLNATP